MIDAMMVKKMSGKAVPCLSAPYEMSVKSTSNVAKTSLPYDFYFGCAVVYKGEIHVMGGSGGNTNHYKWNGTSWTSVSTLPYAFTNGCAVVYKDEIHILGSGNSSYYNAHYKWDGVSWTSVGTLPYYLYHGSAVVYNDEIHIFGGSYNSYTRKYHYRWNGSSWRQVSTLSYEFYYGSAVVWNGKIHLLGGSNSTTNHYVWEDGSPWTSVSTIPYAFYRGSAIVYNNKIIIIGTVASSYNQCYSWDGSAWASIKNLPYYFYDGCSVIYNGVVHILGTQYSSTYYRYHYSIYSETIKRNFALPKDAEIFSKEDVSGVKFQYIDDTGKELIKIPYSFAWGDSLTHNGKIYVFGGTFSDRSCYSYDGNAWTKEPDIPYKFEYALNSAVVYENEIHLLGTGASSQPSSVYRSHYKYNGSEWVSVSTLPFDFNRGTAFVFNGEIHIAYGYYDSANWNKHYKWDGTTWTQLENSTIDCDTPCTMYNGKIYFLDNKNLRAYDGTTWSDVGSIPYRASYGNAVVYGEKLHGISGYEGDDSIPHYEKMHYVYDGTTWTRLRDLPYNAYACGAVFFNNKIHLLGGYRTGSSRHHSIYEEAESPIPMSLGTENVLVSDNLQIIKPNHYKTTKFGCVQLSSGWNPDGHGTLIKKGKDIYFMEVDENGETYLVKGMKANGQAVTADGWATVDKPLLIS